MSNTHGVYKLFYYYTRMNRFEKDSKSHFTIYYPNGYDVSIEVSKFGRGSKRYDGSVQDQYRNDGYISIRSDDIVRDVKEAIDKYLADCFSKVNMDSPVPCFNQKEKESIMQALDSTRDNLIKESSMRSLQGDIEGSERLLIRSRNLENGMLKMDDLMENYGV